LEKIARRIVPVFWSDLDKYKNKKACIINDLQALSLF
jgi:hypothetical protein